MHIFYTTYYFYTYICGMDNTKKCCPMCNGKGQIEDIGIESAVKYAKRLRKQGHSWRKIADVMGYKSHNAVKYLVENK